MGGAAAGQLGFVRGFTRYQWLVFFVVWAGWSLHATDFGLFSLVLRPALTELLGGQPTLAEIGRVGVSSALSDCLAGRLEAFCSVSLPTISGASELWRSAS
jgi:hypothetical protein